MKGSRTKSASHSATIKKSVKGSRMKRYFTSELLLLSQEAKIAA
ncbi:hypothetical protein [Butyrivibrio sp. JL13D10]